MFVYSVHVKAGGQLIQSSRHRVHTCKPSQYPGTDGEASLVRKLKKKIKTHGLQHQLWLKILWLFAQIFLIYNLEPLPAQMQTLKFSSSSLKLVVITRASFSSALIRVCIRSLYWVAKIAQEPEIAADEKS